MDTEMVGSESQIQDLSMIFHIPSQLCWPCCSKFEDCVVVSLQTLFIWNTMNLNACELLFALMFLCKVELWPFSFPLKRIFSFSIHKGSQHISGMA